MKHIVLSSCIALVSLTSCIQQENTLTTQSTPLLYKIPSVDSYNAGILLRESIRQEFDRGAVLTTQWGQPGLLPPYVFQEQLDWKKDENPSLGAMMWNLGKVQLLPVYQTGMNSPVSFGNDYGYAGVLARIQGTEVWGDFFRVPLEYQAIAFDGGPEDLVLTDKNVIGAFTKDARLFIDVADNNGAGSGEGTMTRFVFDESGWLYDGCFYFNGNFSPEPGLLGLRYDPFGQEVRPRSECLL